MAIAGPTAGFLWNVGLSCSSSVLASRISPLLLETEWYGAHFIPLSWSFPEHWELVRRVSQAHKPQTVDSRLCTPGSLAGRGCQGDQEDPVQKVVFLLWFSLIIISPTCLGPKTGQIHIMPLVSSESYVNLRMDIFLSVHKYLLPVRSLVFPEYLSNSSEYNGLLRWLSIRIQSDPHANSHLILQYKMSSTRAEIMSILGLWLNI